MGRRAALALSVLALVMAATAVRAQRPEDETPGPAWELAQAPFFTNAPQVSLEGVPSWLTMRCEGRAPSYRVLTCRFEHVAVRAPTEEQIASRMAEHTRRAVAITPSYVRNTRRRCEADPSAYTACRCFLGGADERYLEDERACMLDDARQAAETRARACLVQTASFTADLERVSPTRWTGSSTRGAGCAGRATVVVEMGSAPRTFRVTHTVLSAAGGPFCDGAPGTVSRFEQGAQSLFSAACSALVPAF